MDRRRKLEVARKRPTEGAEPSPMLASVLCLAASFTPPTVLDRRAALTAAAPALLAASLAAIPGSAFAVGDNKVGYACRGNDDCGVDAGAKRALMSAPGSGSAAGIRFAGTYNDPLHPGCTRKIVLAGGNIIVTGTDEPGGKEWKLKGKTYTEYKAVVIDFSPKGGPKEVIARWNGLGLAFDDGNVWSRKP